MMRHRRQPSELGVLLFVGVVVPLFILWLLFRQLEPAPPPENTSDIFLGHTVPSPVIVRVVNNYIVPTATATPTPSPTATPVLLANLTPQSNYCNPTHPAEGAVCEWPPAAPPTPTPFPACPRADEPTPEPGDRCRWVSPSLELDLWR